MSEEFRKKIKAYMEGTLSEEQQEEMEKELEKMEAYQVILEEQLDHQDRNKGIQPSTLAKEKQSKIIRRGKWKARLQNALTALGLFIIVTIISSAFTSAFYDFGSSSRRETYWDVVRSTVAVTQPNVMVKRGGIHVRSFFTMEIKGDLYKQVGSAEVKGGDIQVNFLFNQASFPNRNWLLDEFNLPTFHHPSWDHPFNTDWDRLERLPQGTVVEGYLSLDRLYETDEILALLKDKDLKPLWFAVDTGMEDQVDNFFLPIGFPYRPIWRQEDRVTIERTVERRGLFTRSVTESAQMPRVEAYGSGDLRNENFMNTLKVLKQNQTIVNRIAYGPPLQLKERIDHLTNEGINIYGVVVTGPAKEILKLEDEPWVTTIAVGEVRLWNWN